MLTAKDEQLDELDEEFFNVLLNGLNLGSELRSFIHCYGTSNDSPGNSTGSSQCYNKDLEHLTISFFKQQSSNKHSDF